MGTVTRSIDGSRMLKQPCKVLVGGTAGLLTIIAGYFFLGLDPGSGPISNEKLIALKKTLLGTADKTR